MQHVQYVGTDQVAWAYADRSGACHHVRSGETRPLRVLAEPVIAKVTSGTSFTGALAEPVIAKVTPKNLNRNLNRNRNLKLNIGLNV